jgi:hypothetical protein
VTGYPHQDLQRELTLRAIREAGLTFRDVWLRYFKCTGAADETELEAHLFGLLGLAPIESDILAHAVNELVEELPHNDALPRAPYHRDLDQPQEE